MICWRWYQVYIISVCDNEPEIFELLSHHVVTLHIP